MTVKCGFPGQLITVVHIVIHELHSYSLESYGISKLLASSLNIREQWRKHIIFLMNLNYKWVTHITFSHVLVAKTSHMILHRHRHDLDLEPFLDHPFPATILPDGWEQRQLVDSCLSCPRMKTNFFSFSPKFAKCFLEKKKCLILYNILKKVLC